MGTWGISVGVEQLQDNFLALAVSALSALNADKDRLVVIGNVHEGLRSLVPEEQAELSSFVSLHP
jgi:hypothetical protein